MVLKDLVPLYYRKHLEKLILDNKEFKWTFFTDSVYPDTDKLFQFIHFVNLDGEAISPYNDDIMKLLGYFELKTGLKVKRVNRIKVNLLTRRDVTEEDNNKGMHRDLYDDEDSKNYISMVYYVNDSDGDTIVFDEDFKTVLERCSPESGTAIWFKSSKLHTATIPKFTDVRVVINFVFEIEELG